MLNRRDLLKSSLGATSMASVTATFAADEFPSRPIRLIVPFAAGGLTDSFARITSSKMAEILGVPILVENRTGAGGTIGAAVVAKAPADGYSFVIGNNGVFSILPYAMKAPPYDPVKELTPFTLTSQVELFLVVNPDKLSARTFGALRTEINALPESSPLRSYASAGIATTHHMAMELLKQRTGLKLTHIPYKGSTPAIQDVLAGQVPLMLSVYSEFGQWAKQGRLKVIGAIRGVRSADLPDVPTLAEQGVPGFDVYGWQAFAVAAGTPPGVVRKLHDAYAKAVEDPATRQKLVTLGAPPMLTSTDEAVRFIGADTANWIAVIKAANISVVD